MTNIEYLLNDIENLEFKFKENSNYNNLDNKTRAKNMSDYLHQLRMIHGSFVLGLYNKINKKDKDLKDLTDISAQSSLIHDLQEKIKDLEKEFDLLIKETCNNNDDMKDLFKFNYEKVKSLYKKLPDGCKLVETEIESDTEKFNKDYNELERKIMGIVNGKNDLEDSKYEELKMELNKKDEEIKKLKMELNNNNMKLNNNENLQMYNDNENLQMYNDRLNKNYEQFRFNNNDQFKFNNNLNNKVDENQQKYNDRINNLDLNNLNNLEKLEELENYKMKYKFDEKYNYETEQDSEINNLLRKNRNNQSETENKYQFTEELETIETLEFKENYDKMRNEQNSLGDYNINQNNQNVDNQKNIINNKNNFLYFYMPNCPHCVNFMNTWDELKKYNKNDDLNYVKLNVNDRGEKGQKIKHLMNLYNIDSFPSLVLLTDKNVHYFEGDRSLNKIINFINNIIN